MVLAGTYPRTLDEKSRLVIPRRLLDDFAEPELNHLFFTPGTEKSLWLYAPKGFERVSRRVDRLRNTLQVRHYKRFFYANTERVELDSQGRIRLTERQIQFAGISGREVVLLGVHDHAEVWDTKAWNACVESQFANFDDLAAQAFEAR